MTTKQDKLLIGLVGWSSHGVQVHIFDSLNIQIYIEESESVRQAYGVQEHLQTRFRRSCKFSKIAFVPYDEPKGVSTEFDDYYNTA